MKEVDREQYLKRGPLAVSNVLKDLEKYQTPVLVTHARGQFISRILYADQQEIVLDYGSNALDNHIALSMDDFHLSADSQGARIEFALSALNEATHEGLPAFQAELPDLLWAIQRREFFRVNAPLEPAFYCYCNWPDGSDQRFRLQDLSLGGIGVLSDRPVPEGLNPGDTLKNLRVELGEYGQFEVEAQLINIGERSIISSKNETVVTPRLSFRFSSVPPVQERQLQQVIFTLERLAREKATRFQ